jgi:hypothetical protein
MVRVGGIEGPDQHRGVEDGQPHSSRSSSR